jgi:Tol biopolymer transport system component
MSSSQTRQQRRAADRRGDSYHERERLLRLLFGLVVLAGIGLGGWWVYRQATGLGVVREGAPSWSPDSQQIAYYSEQDGKADIFITNLAGSSRVNLTTSPAADEGGPAFSPDGRWVAFDTDRDGNFEIYARRTDQSAERPLTNHPGRDLAPAWSPDGQWIVFMSTRDNPEFDLYRMRADGSDVERLTHGGSNWFPQYSPDGTNIAFHAMRDVHVLNLATRQVRRLTHEPLNGMYPTWSADGRRLAFMSWRNGRTEIFTMDADGSNQQRLVSMPSGDAVDPRWSPNGEYIAFVHVPSGGLADAQDRSQRRILYLVELATSRLIRLSR